MATKKQTSTSKKDDTKVTRIKAADTKPAKKKTPEPKAAALQVQAEEKGTKSKRANPLKATGNYFKGAWDELKQVRWPTRRATWGMTAALIGFTAFFIAFILLLDAIFQYSFDLIIG